MKNINNPYPYFFMFGLFNALLGGAIWILYQQHIIQTYPAEQHSGVMIVGFLFAFATGFLMTASPKFTASFPTTAKEYYVGLTITFFLTLNSVFYNKYFFWPIALVDVLFLIFFLARRFKNRKNNIPDPFLFVFFAFASATFGILIKIANMYFTIGYEQLSALLFNEAIFTFLAFGLGSRLVPAFSGHQIDPKSRKYWVSIAILLMITYFTEALTLNIIYSRISRAIILSWLIINHWKILIPPPTQIIHAKMMRLSGILMIGGFWLSALFIDYKIHLLHIMYIGGFGLITLLIATRVTLAHGGHGLKLENNPKLAFLTMILSIAIAFRSLSAIISQYYLQFLGLAAFFWILALGIWMSLYFKKLFIKM